MESCANMLKVLRSKKERKKPKKTEKQLFEKGKDKSPVCPRKGTKICRCNKTMPVFMEIGKK